MKLLGRTFNSGNTIGTIMSILVLVVVAAGIRQTIVLNNESYQSVKLYFEKSITIQKYLGKDIKISSSKLISMKFEGLQADAVYNLNLTGNKQNATLNLQLKKETGLWKIENALLYLGDNNAIQLPAE